MGDSRTTHYFEQVVASKADRRILKIPCVLKIFSKPGPYKNSPATGVKRWQPEKLEIAKKWRFWCKTSHLEVLLVYDLLQHPATQQGQRLYEELVLLAFYKFTDYSCGSFFVLFWIHTASETSTAETHTVGGAVIRNPVSAWLQGSGSDIAFFQLAGAQVKFFSQRRIPIP